MLQLFFLIDNESAAPVDTSEKEQNHQPSDFDKEFTITVKAYEKDFMSWQAGSKVDVFSARKAILPLVDLSLSSPEKVFKKLLQLKEKDYLHRFHLYGTTWSNYGSKNANGSGRYCTNCIGWLFI